MSCYPWSEPRSCECLRQCLATPTIVDVPQPDDRPFACFARRGAAPALQLSDFPGEGAEGATGGAPRAGGAARAGRVPSGRGCLCRVLPDEGVDYYASSEQGAAPISTEALLELYYGKAVEALGPGVTRRRNKELVPLAQCPGAVPGAEAARLPQPPAACCGARPAPRALTAPTDSVSGLRLAGNCSWEGACYRETRGGGDLGPPQCKCYAGSDGDSCQARLAAACTNECSGRGRCLRGVCSCDLGYFGLDCSVDLSVDSAARDPVAMPDPLPAAAAAARSKATLSAALRPPSSADPQSAWPSAQSARRRAPPRPWAGGGLHPAHGCALPRVYVYELPAWLGVACNVDRGAGDSPTAGYGPYSAPMTLHARLLADWAVRTLDPDEADIFYIPSLLYGCHGNLQPANRYLVKQARCWRGLRRHGFAGKRRMLLAALLWLMLSAVRPQVDYLNAHYPFWGARGGCGCSRSAPACAGATPGCSDPNCVTRVQIQILRPATQARPRVLHHHGPWALPRPERPRDIQRRDADHPFWVLGAAVPAELRPLQGRGACPSPVSLLRDLTPKPTSWQLSCCLHRRRLWLPTAAGGAG